MPAFLGQQLPAGVPSWAPWAALAALAGAFLWTTRSTLDGNTGSGGIPDPSPGDPFGGAPVDDYAARDLTQEGQCDPVARPGVLAFRRWAIDTWGPVLSPNVQNIVRDCSVGGPSEHKEGRAWDLMTRDKAHGQEVADALTAPAPDGTPNALARRAGIVNMIWNKQIWRAYPQGDLPAGVWGPYSGSNPHTDHVHISFGWPGAMGDTSLYTSGVAPLSPDSA